MVDSARSQHLHAAFLVISIALLGLMALVPKVSMAGVSSKGPCSEAREIDYAEPIADLPPVPMVPKSGNLPFGPPRLSLEPLMGPVLVGPGSVGYELFLDQRVVRQRVSVNWLVELHLYRVNSQGGRVQSYPEATRVVGAVANKAFNGKRLALHAPGKPGFYLFEMSFRQRGEKSSFKTYAEYFRVVKPKLDAHLVVKQPTIKAGETAYFWIENRGTKTLGLKGEEFILERYLGSEWEIDPASPKGFRRKALAPLTAGQAGFCRSLVIPADTPSGLYRFSKRVRVIGHSSPRILRAEFEVQAP